MYACTFVYCCTCVCSCAADCSRVYAQASSALVLREEQPILLGLPANDGHLSYEAQSPAAVSSPTPGGVLLLGNPSHNAARHICNTLPTPFNHHLRVGVSPS